MFDPMLKMLADQFGDDWIPFILQQIGLSPDTVVVPLDSTLPAVSLEADRIFRVEVEPPFLLHVEFESSRPPGRPARFLKYNIIASDREELPCRTVVLLLRPEAQSQDLTGELTRDVPGRPGYLVFQYDVIRLWQIPKEVLLAGGPGLWPLVPLGNLNESSLETVMHDLFDHWNTVPEQVALELASATEILMGLRYSEEFIDQVLRRLESMEESVTYQRILRRGEERGRRAGREQGLEEGRQEGRDMGKIEHARQTVVRMLGRRFDEVSESVRTGVANIDDLDRLDRMVEATLSVASPEEVLKVP